MEQQKSFKDKTINDCKCATPLYKADILRMTLDTLGMNTKQPVNFLEVSFLQKWTDLGPWLCHNDCDYTERKRLFSCIPLSSQVKWLLLHVDIQEDWCFPPSLSACGHRVIHRLEVAALRLFSLKITTKSLHSLRGLSHWVTSQSSECFTQNELPNLHFTDTLQSWQTELNINTTVKQKKPAVSYKINMIWGVSWRQSTGISSGYSYSWGWAFISKLLTSSWMFYCDIVILINT